MTARQALHLIEQFAAQAPFAVWITDSRGVAVFANKKLHELFSIPEHPSGALGFNLFEDPSLAGLHLQDASERLKKGEIIDLIIDIPRPENVETAVKAERVKPLTIRVTAYALKNSAQAIEHYVIIIEDVTETYIQREKLRQRLHDIAIYNSSKESRIAKIDELRASISALEEEIARITKSA